VIPNWGQSLDLVTQSEEGNVTLCFLLMEWKTMSDSNGNGKKGPTHRVYTLLPRKGEDGKDDNFWLNIGSAFEHSDHKGFNIILEALPLDGKVVLREVKEPEPEPAKKTYSKR
jgi:hypothetical protein